MSASGLMKPERKVIEKNRRNQMKFLYSRLFSLIPPDYISKGGDQVSNRVDTTIDYIQTLKTNLEMNKKKKDRLLSKKRSHEHMKINNVCKSLEIQIHEMGHELDAVSVTGLNNRSSFCNFVQLLDQYCTEITLANFSSSGHSTFHIRQKKIEAEDIRRRLKISLEGHPNMKESEDNINASFLNEIDSDLSVWDFDLQTNVWGWELEMLPLNIIS